MYCFTNFICNVSLKNILSYSDNSDELRSSLCRVCTVWYKKLENSREFEPEHSWGVPNHHCGLGTCLFPFLNEKIYNGNARHFGSLASISAWRHSHLKNCRLTVILLYYLWLNATRYVQILILKCSCSDISVLSLRLTGRQIFLTDNMILN